MNCDYPRIMGVWVSYNVRLKFDGIGKTWFVSFFFGEVGIGGRTILRVECHNSKELIEKITYA